MRLLIRKILPLLAIALIISCNDDSTGPDTEPDPDSNSDPEPTTGIIEITTSTSGEDQDEDGYTVTLGDNEEDISASETITFEELDEGSYDTELTDVADNCSVDGDNPRSIEVTAGETVSETFEVTCETVGQEKIVFYVSDGEYGTGLRMMNPDGEDEQEITGFDGAKSYPAISNDGSKIAFVDDETSTEAIYIMDADGSNVQKIYNDELWDFPSSLSWSPDDTKIAFQIGRGSIFTIEIETGDIDEITTEEMNGESPDWSPNGNKIIFSSGSNDSNSNENDLFIANLEDGTINQLTDNSDHETSPRWSPDGTKIAFVSDQEGSNIHTMDSDGSNVQKIIEATDETTITWSPDGSELLYMNRYKSDNYERMRKINADGSGEYTNLKWTFHNTIHQPDWGKLDLSK